MTNANSVIFELISKSKTRIDVCGDYGIQESFYTEGDLFRKSIRDSKNSSGITPRCIIEITAENIDYCRKLMKTADLRHMDKLKGNFVLNGRECVSITLIMEKGKIVPHLVHSVIKEVVEQQQYVFDTFWKVAIPAKEKINEIEGKHDDLFQPRGNKDIVRVIRKKDKIESLLKSCIYNARSEVLIAISSIHYLTYLHKIGLEGILEHAKLQGATIILLFPEDDGSELGKNVILPSFIDNIKNYAQIKSVSGLIGNLLLVDNSKILTISTEDLKESMDNNFVGVYTDNKSIVSNFGSLFDTLLSEKELLNSIISVKNQLERSNLQLLESNERLRINSKNQKEFINIAAHELRTPTQAIIGFTEMMEEDSNNYHKYINSISRNANRLEKLVEDLLDTAKIESDNLVLNKEKTDLNELLSTTIQSAKIDLENTQKKERKTYKKFYNANKTEKEKENEHIDICLFPGEKHPNTMSSAALYVMIDREKIIRAISNLLSNSIKSIGNDGGRIAVTVSKRNKEKNNSFKKNEILISFKDTGKGINSEMHSRLFNKFTTNSSSGTGLGLYITKSIIEAHGGQIWAENNDDGNGATFSFSLPAL
ncbi:MAG: ATP-binding protein [Thermoproteota archaeon]|nr:ATP-binding protein [Thermoproteota archaeon]